jgi:SAM-dependent methyltransferase
MKGPIQSLHDGYVHGRRVRRLCELLACLIPESCSVLDVGCGDGLLARLIQDRRPDLALRGIDVLVREHTLIPVEAFDGRSIPRGDDSVDVIMFVDVLHHTDDPTVLLAEAARVARRAVLIKDHLLEGFLAGRTLRFMDYVGNTHHGVALPYNYWPRGRWQQVFDKLGLTPEEWRDQLGLYPWPANLLFGRSLHFVARLGPITAPQPSALPS